MNAGAGSAGGLPMLTVAALDADPHGVFRHWRATHPVVAQAVRGADDG
jgi:hypothetical protein